MGHGKTTRAQASEMEGVLQSHASQVNIINEKGKDQWKKTLLLILVLSICMVRYGIATALHHTMTHFLFRIT